MWNFELAKKVLEESGYTRAHTAQALHVKRNTLTNYLNGHGRPSDDFVNEFAAFFKMKPETFMWSRPKAV